ncbi:DUF5993 family protein [uncultured Legionella sp.]
MMILLFLLYFLIGIQLLIKPNRSIPLQFLLCLILTLCSFNFHSHLVHL